MPPHEFAFRSMVFHTEAAPALSSIRTALDQGLGWLRAFTYIFQGLVVQLETSTIVPGEAPEDLI